MQIKMLKLHPMAIGDAGLYLASHIAKYCDVEQRKGNEGEVRPDLIPQHFRIYVPWIVAVVGHISQVA